MGATLVIGASPNPDRYSHRAVVSLRARNYEVIAFGPRKGSILDIPIQQSWDETWDVDTVTLYINATVQQEYYQRIIDLQPRRVIFNPGTENPEFYRLLKDSNVHVEVACTLVMLSIGNY